MSLFSKSFSSFQRELFCVFGLILLTCLVFGNSLGFEFTNFDDNEYVNNNLELTRGLSWDGIRWAFEANWMRLSRGSEYWQPLTLLTRLMDWQLYGFEPEGHRLTSLLIHLATGICLFFVLKSATSRHWESWLVAVFFLIHPMHVEPVCWMSARKDLVSGLTYVIALWAYIQYSRNPGIGRYSLLTVAFVLANLAKPMAVSLPLLFLLMDYWPLRRLQGSQSNGWPLLLRLILEKIPFFLIAICVGALAYFTQKGIGAMNDGETLPLLWRLGNAILASGTYIFKAAVPIDLALLYPHPARSLNLLLTALSAGVLASLFVAAYYWRNKKPWILFGLLWFFFVLGPVLGIIQIGDQAMADRYTYLSFIGLFIAVVWEISFHLRNRVVSFGKVSFLAGAVILVFAYTAWLQAQTWRNSLSAFSHAVEVTRNNYIMHYNLGAELLKLGRRDEADWHLKEAIRIRRPVLETLIFKAEEDISRRDYASAATRLNRVRMLMPWDVKVNMRLGEVHHLKGERALGQKAYALAFKYQPDSIPPRLALARSLAEEGRLDDAKRVLHDAIRIDPSHQEVQQFLKELD